MVDLGIKPTASLTEAPKPVLSSQDIYRGSNAIGAGLTDLASGLEAVGKVFAEDAGRADAKNAISRDENGAIRVERPQSSFILGGMGEAYASAKKAELQVAIRSEMDIKLAELSRQFEGKPQDFQKAAAAYVDQRRKDFGENEIGAMAWRYGQASATQHFGGMVEAQATRDFKQTAAVLQGRLSILQGQEESLQLQGAAPDNPEIQRIRAERAEIRGELERNPKFNYNAELRRQDELGDQQRAAGLSVAYSARQRIRNGEPLEAVIVDVEEKLGKLGLQNDQLQKLVAIARQNTVGVAAARTAERERASAEADLAIGKLRGGDLVTQEQLGLLVARLAANGGQKKAAELLAWHMITEEIMPALRFGNSGEKAFAMQQFKELQEKGVTVPGMRGSGASGPAAAASLAPAEVGLLNAIAGPESAGRYNVRYTASGGASFTPGDDHPRVRERIATGPNAGRTSDAAGRYQFLSSTWDSLPAEAKGDGRFTAENQDRAAVYLAKRDYKSRTGRDLMADIAQNGLTEGILQTLAPTWEGFKSPAGRAKALAAFNNQGGAGAPTAFPVRDSVVREVQKTYDQQIDPIAQRITDAFTRRVPPTQQDMDDFQNMYPLTSRSDEKGVLKKLYEAEAKYRVEQNLPVGEGLRAFVQTLDNAEKGGQATPAQSFALKVAKGVQEEQEKLRKSDPLELASRDARRANMGDIFGQRRAIDWGNPDAAIGELSLRRHQSDWARAVDPMSSHMPLYEDDRKSLAAALPAMNADQARAALGAMSSAFTREQMNALMGDKDVRDAVVGLTRSTDPAKMKVGFEAMAKQLQDNHLEFRNTFGESAEKALYQYQVLASEMTPEQITERLTKPQSPRDADTRKRWETAAAAAMEKMTSVNIFKEVNRAESGFMKYWTGFGADKFLSEREMEGMLFDYSQAYKSYYGEFGHEATAKAWAADRVRQNWGTSAASGRMMRLPPEKAGVPQIDGSHDWMNGQLQGDIVKALGVDADKVRRTIPSFLTPPGGPVSVPGGRPALTVKEQRAAAIMRGDFELVADGKTEADIANKRPPSYIVLVKNPNGMPEPLAIEPGKVVRWWPDHKRAQDEARPGLMRRDTALRNNRQDAPDVVMQMSEPMR